MCLENVYFIEFENPDLDYNVDCTEVSESQLQRMVRDGYRILSYELVD